MCGMTSIAISKETWKKLNALKDFGQTFDDVVKGLADKNKTYKEPVKK